MLPDEPHAFSAEDEAVLHAALPNARVVRTSGKDLFWYGAWTIDAMPRVCELAIVTCSARNARRSVRARRATCEEQRRLDELELHDIGRPASSRAMSTRPYSADRDRRERRERERAFVVGDRERAGDAFDAAANRGVLRIACVSSPSMQMIERSP